MTHAEAAELLPLYALNALDEAQTADLEVHVSDCHACARELRTFVAAAADLGGAVPALTPPPHLRERLLASAGSVPAAAPVPTSADPASGAPLQAPGRRPVPLPPQWERRGEGRLLRFPARAPSWLAAAVLVVALASGAAAGFTRDAADRAQLRTDDAALALLTSTETTVDRLDPVAAGLPADAHGHWYHRDGVPTQVVVGEFLPPLPAGEHWTVWQRQGQTWQRAGELDARGRLVLLGSDGAGVSAVEVTREASAPAQPGANVALRFSRGG